MPTPTHQTDSAEGIALSGMRPTGRMHLGKIPGVLQNWVALPGGNRCTPMVVGIHSLTTLESPLDAADIQPNVAEMVLDLLAANRTRVPCLYSLRSLKW